MIQKYSIYRFHDLFLQLSTTVWSIFGHRYVIFGHLSIIRFIHWYCYWNQSSVFNAFIRRKYRSSICFFHSLIAFATSTNIQHTFDRFVLGIVGHCNVTHQSIATCWIRHFLDGFFACFMWFVFKHRQSTRFHVYVYLYAYRPSSQPTDKNLIWTHSDTLQQEFMIKINISIDKCERKFCTHTHAVCSSSYMLHLEEEKRRMRFYTCSIHLLTHNQCSPLLIGFYAFFVL